MCGTIACNFVSLPELIQLPESLMQQYWSRWPLEGDWVRGNSINGNRGLKKTQLKKDR